MKNAISKKKSYTKLLRKKVPRKEICIQRKLFGRYISSVIGLKYSGSRLKIYIIYNNLASTSLSIYLAL